MIFHQWVFFGIISDWFEWHFWRDVFIISALLTNHYEKKMIEMMKKLKLNKIFELNKIMNWFLKICIMILLMCWYHFFKRPLIENIISKWIKKNNTMILRKFDKNNYNIIKKKFNCFFKHNEQNFKSIINKKLSYLTKHHDWLLTAQMKTQLNKLTKIVLKYWTNAYDVKNWNK